MVRHCQPRYRRTAGLLFTRLWAVAWLAGCAAQAPLLNSEQIAARYGSYDIQVLQQDEQTRVSSLASQHGARWITRTLAITLFAGPDEALAHETRLIRNGASIGSTFKKAGWHIEKKTIYTGPFDATKPLGIIEQLMGIALPARLALHAYRFDVQRGADVHTFATIFELHHPDYFTVNDLQRQLGADRNAQDANTATLLSFVADTLAKLTLPGGHAL